MPPSRRAVVRAALTALATTACALLAGVAPAASAAGAAADDGEPTVVVIGTTGLRWDDVRTLSTPALWDLSRRGGVGTVAARSVHAAACPADGWLSLNAGTRLADRDSPDDTCRTLREVTEGRTVPGWADFRAAAAEQPYSAVPGRLGDLLAEAGVPATGIGPGAAIALADGAGYPVGTAVRSPADPADLEREVRTALETSRLVVVDAGSVRDPGKATRIRTDDTYADAPEAEEPGLLPTTDDEPPEGVAAIVEPTRADQVREVDERVEAVLEAVSGAAGGSDVTVLLVSLADSGRVALQLAVATGPAPDGERYDESLLSSGSTRQPGVVQSVDVLSTVLAALGEAAPEASSGAPIVPVPGPATGTARVRVLDDISIEARQVTRVSGSYLTRLVLAQAALFLLAALLLTRPVTGRRPMRRGLRALEVAALALASAPIASFLADTVPWWRAGSPVSAFWLAVLAWTTVITAVSLTGPWRRALLGPAAVVSGVTVAVLVVDALIGSPLVIDSPMGAHRLMAARFYGMSNQSFALLAAASLVLATAVAQALLERGRRGWATASVIVIGVVVTVVDGAPGLGSDFGGPPGMILAFAVLATVVAGRHVRWRPLLLVAVVGAVVVVGFAGLDWLREPADRTHLGRFFATVVDGGLWRVLLRKLEVHLRVLTYWRYLVLAVGGVLVTALVLRGSRPHDGAPSRGPMAGLRDSVPLLGACVAAVGIVLGVGFLINDSGIIVPATGIAVAVPCLLAAAARRRLAEPGAERPVSPPRPAGARA